MRKIILSLGALTVGVAIASASAFAQNTNGPSGQNYGAGSGAQTGGTNYKPIGPQVGQGSHNVAPQHRLYNVVPQQQTGPNGPAGQNYGAGSGAQSGGTNYKPTSPL